MSLCNYLALYMYWWILNLIYRRERRLFGGLIKASVIIGVRFFWSIRLLTGLSFLPKGPSTGSSLAVFFKFLGERRIIDARYHPQHIMQCQTSPNRNPRIVADLWWSLGGWMVGNPSLLLHSGPGKDSPYVWRLSTDQSWLWLRRDNSSEFLPDILVLELWVLRGSVPSVRSLCTNWVAETDPQLFSFDTAASKTPFKTGREETVVANNMSTTSQA